MITRMAKASLLLLSLLPMAVVQAEENYNLNTQGAVADHVYYQIGGGSVISPSLARRSPNALTMGLGWNNNMMCGNFDLNTTVKNQLNGVTKGFQDLMGNVINSATGAVASLPAMVIQRANPQLYDLLTNGVLQGRLDFDKARLSCEQMAQKATDYAFNSVWEQNAKAENYQAINANESDAVRAEQRASKEGAEQGKRWVGGERRGGRGQPPIRVVRDTVVAGYNILNNRTPASTAGISDTDCKGELCTIWSNPEAVANWTTRAIGEQTVNVAAGNDTASNENNRSGAKAGVGLNPLIEEEQEKIMQLVVELVNRKQPVNHETLALASGGNLQLTRGVVEALRDDIDASILIRRLSGELALAKVMEQALMARRTLLAGMREPWIANEKAAQDTLGTMTQQLDQELSQLKLELDLRHTLANNASIKILERKAQRDLLQGRAVETQDDINRRIHELNQPDGEGR